MTLRELAIAVGFNVNQSSVNRAESSIRGIKNMATKLLGAIGIGLSITGIGNLAEAAADVEALKSQFSQVFGDVEADASEKLQKISDDTGILVNRMKSSFTQMAAFAKTTGMNEADALNLSNRAMVAVADSAAFYDRSLEDVSESLRSLLKGNFENDAALGFSCTETTRNAAANALYGKSFKDLAEDQKQLTLLQMVEDANKASGALGQAARESDTWTNQMGNAKQAIQDFKAAIGSGFLKYAVQGLKLFNESIQKATEKVSKFTREGGPLNRVIDKTIFTVKGFIGIAKQATDKLGGVDNTAKITAAILASAFIVRNAGAFISFLNKVKTVIMAINVKTLALIAVIALIFLVVDDFINFMKGNDSVIGSILEKAGVDTEKVRNTVIKAWEKVKTFLINAWTIIKQVAGAVWDGLKTFFEEHAGQIKRILLSAWQIITTLFYGIKEIAETIFSALSDFWDEWGETIMEEFDLIFGFIGDLFEIFLDRLQNILNFINDVFAGDWSSAWEDVKNIFGDTLKEILRTGKFIMDSIEKFFGDKIDAIKDKVLGWYEDIVEKVQGVAGFIGDLLGLDGSVDIGVTANTASKAATSSQTNKSVTQNNTINNTVNGSDRKAALQSLGLMDNATNDIVSRLKNTMAYN